MSSTKNCSTLNVLFSDVEIDYVDIARRSSARRRQTRAGWGKTDIYYNDDISITLLLLSK